ncbi:hypothetical protein GO495_03610 [Chitinophaga oryziterrae]|uniref:Uncharacterized protein n=1 Tax=Chitinophaga oryziterrae TaxID=1031224 RepID=A0A6N8J614_9BACT|nr:hypothetical protein [Chitinophaga oryziterrae]MVT39659.1 hypothetical protein [Chitinophaga oryziterrae]
MNILGFDYSSGKLGSDGHEWFKDAAADQQAIKTGFFYKVGTTEIRGAGNYHYLPLKPFD